MAFGYVIAQIAVTDAEAYPKYVARVEPIVRKYGGEFIVRGGRAESFESAPLGDRNVVIRFPDFEAAQGWYHPDDYASAKALRMAASTSIQTIVEGV